MINLQCTKVVCLIWCHCQHKFCHIAAFIIVLLQCVSDSNTMRSYLWHYLTAFLKAVLQNILKKLISYIFFEISLQIYIKVVRKKNTYFHFFALKTDTSLFCHRDIPTIHNGYCVSNAVDYCVSNAVDYAKKNYVLPTICRLN